MNVKGEAAMLEQIAAISGCLQKFKLPESINGFGGATFDDEGVIVSAGMSNVEGGPWASYEESYIEQFKSSLMQADANPFIQGWRANGVRERLEAFVESGSADSFQSLSSRDERVIVHGDFTTNNMLFDGGSNRITALLEYDFACISHPSQEFFRSMHDFGGHFPG